MNREPDALFEQALQEPENLENYYVTGAFYIRASSPREAAHRTRMHVAHAVFHVTDLKTGLITRVDLADGEPSGE
jgi:hypothetical protein